MKIFSIVIFLMFGFLNSAFAGTWFNDVNVIQVGTYQYHKAHFFGYPLMLLRFVKQHQSLARIMRLANQPWLLCCWQ